MPNDYRFDDVCLRRTELSLSLGMWTIDDKTKSEVGIPASTLSTVLIRTRTTFRRLNVVEDYTLVQKRKTNKTDRSFEKICVVQIVKLYTYLCVM